MTLETASITLATARVVNTTSMGWVAAGFVSVTALVITGTRVGTDVSVASFGVDGKDRPNQTIKESAFSWVDIYSA